MNRLFVVALLFLFAHHFVFAQQPSQTIRGVIVDQASNASLDFADVIVLNTDPLIGATSDSLGNFILEKVPVGRYDIQVSLVGYESFLIREVQVSAAKEVVLNITMKEQGNTLGEVVVRARINKELPLNASATLSAKMLSVEEAQRYAGGFDDPARLVSSFAGVSSNVGNNAIVVRGNSPQALQWKLEGVEIPNPNHFADLGTFGGGGLTALSSQLMANSDFFSGAFPAEYNNALSGVFDLFMRKGNANKREHTLQVGLIGIDLASEGPFKREKKSSYLFNYRYSTLSLLAPLLPENAGAVRYQDLSYKLHFPTKKAGEFSLWGIGLIDASGAKAKEHVRDWKYDSDREQQDVKQYMGATGIGHKINLNEKQFIKTNLASTLNGLQLSTDRQDSSLSFSPKNKIDNTQGSIVLSSVLNSKFNPRHHNKTGFTATGLHYNIALQHAPQEGVALQQVVRENGFSTLLSAYSHSTLHLSEKWTGNIGLNGQLFTLNNRYTLEPRIGIKYQFKPAQSLSFAYGLHSRLERLNYYFAKNEAQELINKNLDFSKSHHWVMGYNVRLNEINHLKVEIYYQHLFHVPVIKDSSFSVINLQNDWFFDHPLENTGEGQNYGIDITFEKYLSKGYYYLITASLFNSQYKGGDKQWRNTRYNRNFAFNFLTGKEWRTGSNDQNVLGLNIRMSYQGGDRYSPINTTASINAQEAISDEKKAFSQQFPAAFTAHFTANYTLNKQKTAHTFSLKIINLTGHPEFSGFEYNYPQQKIDERRETIFIPNLSYKIEF